MLSDQRGAVLRQGGHVLSRRFRYYVPDFSGKVVVQTPIIVRLVLIFLVFSVLRLFSVVLTVWFFICRFICRFAFC